jgi:SAM-dependent methyltransferase
MLNVMDSKTLDFSPDWTSAAGLWPVDLETDPTLRRSYDVLRAKWCEVPSGVGTRRSSLELLKQSDKEVLAAWADFHESTAAGQAYAMRGWYRTLYSDAFRGKKILDFGCGLAPDSVVWADRMDARVTFVDVVESNVRFVERVCRLKRVRADFCVLEDLRYLNQLPADFDVIWCCGSFHHSPLEMARMEAQALLRHLPRGGRWIQLAYPKSRWEREGRMPPNTWGNNTDGAQTPWAEWHDLAKVRYFLAPAEFDLVFTLEFHNADFNWFDLIRRT